MKDNRLEKEFGEYFEGVKTPDNITEKAKQYAKKKRSASPAVVKYLSAAASLVLVCAVALTLVFSGTFGSLNDSNGKGNFVAEAPNSPAPDSPSDGVSGGTTDESDGDDGEKFFTYTADEMTFESVDAVTETYPAPALGPLKKLAYDENAEILNCVVGYLDGELVLVRAEIIFADTSEEAELYIEFTDLTVLYEPLTEYLKGTLLTDDYYNCTYVLSQKTGKDGESVYNLFVYYNNVKYYVSVKSSDENCYKRFLELICEG